MVKVWLHSTGDASPPAALLLAQILPVFSVVAPCRRGASPVSVRRQTFTTDCEPASIGSHHILAPFPPPRLAPPPCRSRQSQEIPGSRILQRSQEKEVGMA